MQSVFRIKPAPRRAPRAAKKRSFHARRSHTKSRGGCGACKERRVKCDERRPICGICAAKETECIYATVDSALAAFNEADFILSNNIGPTTEVYNLTIQHVESRIKAAIGDACQDRRLSSHSKLLWDLQHFTHVTAFQLGMKTNQKILTSSVSDGIWTHPSLMHLTLALSNAHAKRLHPIEIDAALNAQLAFAEMVHWQLGLELYLQELRSFDKNVVAYGSHGDEMVASTYLLMVLAFCMEDEIPIDTFKTGNTQRITQAINPIAAAGSLQQLMRIAPPLQVKSSWRMILAAVANSYEPLGIESLPPAFVELCELTTDTPGIENNLYYRMLCHIVPLLRLKPCMRNLSKLFGLIGDFWDELQLKITSWDTRMLLLFSWWLALLETLNKWWIVTRARSARLAVLAYLHSIEDKAKLLEPFLAYPTTLEIRDSDWIWKSPPAATGQAKALHDQ